MREHETRRGRRFVLAIHGSIQGRRASRVGIALTLEDRVTKRGVGTDEASSPLGHGAAVQGLDNAGGGGLGRRRRGIARPHQGQRCGHATSGVSREGRSQRTEQPYQRRVLQGRAGLRGREERPVKVFDNLSDTTPTTFADLRTNVYNFWDRGLLGLALDPQFPTRPYVYVLYTYDAPIGGTAPRWGDTCPSPPGPTTDGCPASGRLSRLQASGNTMTGSEQVLINAWCQQFPSHSVADLAFGPDGALYASAGEGSNPSKPDYGQNGGSPGSPVPRNPCGDPPGGVGATLAPPTTEGGSLRSQSPRRPAGEPRLLNGTVIRVNPATGAAMADNPM